MPICALILLPLEAHVHANALADAVALGGSCPMCWLMLLPLKAHVCATVLIESVPEEEVAPELVEKEVASVEKETAPAKKAQVAAEEKRVEEDDFSTLVKRHPAQATKELEEGQRWARPL